jgi:hypothetical protein
VNETQMAKTLDDRQRRLQNPRSERTTRENRATQVTTTIPYMDIWITKIMDKKIQKKKKTINKYNNINPVTLKAAHKDTKFT